MTLCLCKFSYASLVLNFDSDGKLTGATGIDVGYGYIYDVAFARGSCVEIFDGCDQPSDFLFNYVGPAVDVSTALETQVFENFDRDGCAQPNGNCSVATPFNLGMYWYPGDDPSKRQVTVAYSEDYYRIPEYWKFDGFDVNINNISYYAVWSVHVETPASIPAPPVAMLVLLGSMVSLLRLKKTK